jgi:hypothetical protein
MPTLTLTISPDYTRNCNWGVWEALRELFQNALDGEDAGWPMKITRAHDKGRPAGEGIPIRIENVGARLARETLLLGATSKHGSDARGHFGEGYKLALATLLRLGYSVVIKNHCEIWEPALEPSEDFDGATVLKIKIRECRARDRVSFEVFGVTEETWKAIKDRVLALSPPTDVIKVGDDSILTSEGHRGMLFSRGLYVCHMPGLSYGYDFARLTLDRDRRVADHYSLGSSILTVLTHAVELNRMDGETLLALLETESAESRALYDHLRWHTSGTALSKAVLGAFRAKYGEAIPITNIEQGKLASQVGLSTITVSAALQKVVELEIGDFAKLSQGRASEIKTRYGYDTLTRTEQECLDWATLLVADVVPGSLDTLTIVDFYGASMWGRRSADGSIALARKALASPSEAIATLVHEVAHAKGGDGDGTHREEIERIFGEIAARNIRL